MRAKILRIIDEETVEFSTSIGNGIGKCKKKNLKEGVIYGVEFDINESIKLGKNAKKVSNKSFFIRYDGQSIEMQGMVEKIDEDGIIYFRIAIDCILMIELENDEIKEGEYLLLDFNAEFLQMTIVGI